MAPTAKPGPLCRWESLRSPPFTSPGYLISRESDSLRIENRARDRKEAAKHRTTESTALSWALDVRRSALGVRFDRVKFKAMSHFSVSAFQYFSFSLVQSS